MVLLIGNYRPDQWHSMLRFNQMMLDGLQACGVEAQLIRPPAVFGRITIFGKGVAKWLGYVDKFVLFRRQLRRALAARPSVVHICDHSNAVYASAVQGSPLVITCHDLLAVRGALNEKTDSVPSRTGRILQRWILRGLNRADVVACVSSATAADAQRLIPARDGRPRLTVVELGLNYPYHRLPTVLAAERLRPVRDLKPGGRFILHVGSNTPRKNREGLLRMVARCAERLDAQIVFAGEALPEKLRQQAVELNIADRIVEIVDPPTEVLEALYSSAFAFLFPSRFEGFGWPVIEAQACGCPVVCSSIAPVGDIAGAGALQREPQDEAGFAEDLLRLADPKEHQYWSEKALENAARFSSARMIDKYREIYRTLAPAC